MTTTTNMGLLLATVSETLGPEWATLLNAIIQRLDEHDHTTGNGTKVTPAGMLINEGLDLLGNELKKAAFLGLNSQADGTEADAGSLVRIGTNVWWKNAAGAMVQLTSGTALATPSSGAITASAPGSYPYTVTSGDAQTVLVVDSSAARTINLPAATTSMFFIVKDGAGQAATNNISVAPDGTDLIDGVNASYLIEADYASKGFVSDGVSSWYVV